MNDKVLKYSAFCKNAEDLPIFLHDWYLDGVAGDEKWDVAIVEEGGKAIAFMPYFLKSKWGFTYFTMPSFVKYLGPYILPAYRVLKKEHLIQKQLIDQLPKTAAFKQGFSPLITNWLPFYWAGYQQTTRYTYRIEELQNLDAVYRGINRNLRRNIKKAEANLLLKEDLPIETFYLFNKKSFDRQGLPIPYSLDQLKKHDDSLQKHNARKILYATDQEGKIYSVAYLIWDKTASYYHLSGDDPDYRNSGSGIWLVWKAIEYTSKELKLNTFDFEGSIMPAVEKIRVQFGAKQTPYFFIWKYHSWLYKQLEHLRGK